MTAFYVFLGMTLFNTLLSLCPVTLRLSFEEEFAAQVRFLFFRFTLCPRPQKPEKEEEAQEKPKEESRLKRLLRAKGLPGFLSVFTGAAKIAAGTAKRLFRHLTVGEFSLWISVAGEDAAQAALRYARVCAAVGTSAGLFFGNVRCGDRTIRISPDFRSSQSRVLFRADLSIRLMFLLSAALYALFGSVRLFRKTKGSPNSSNHQKKAVFSNGGPSD